MRPVVAAIQGGLVVSCQARAGHPLHGGEFIAALAECAVAGGADGLRLDGPDNIARVRAATGLPIIGINKHFRGPDRPVITPTFDDAALVARAGADIVAAEAVAETGTAAGFADLTTRVHAELAVAVMADIATADEGRRAWEAGADLVGTTLSGYTSGSGPRTGPDLDLVAALAADGVRVVLEGSVHTPGHVREGFAHGAWAVVVGKAITDPLDTTRRFADGTPARHRPR